VCNLNLYLNDTLIMEDVEYVEKKDDKIIVRDIFGEVKEVSGSIVKLDLNEKRIDIKS